MALTTHTNPYVAPGDDLDQLRTFTFGPYAAAALADGNYPLMCMPFAGDVENIALRASALAGANNDAVQFKVAASGTAIGSASNITAAEPLDSTNGGSGFTLAADTWVTVPLTGNNTRLGAGTQISMTTSGTIASLAGLMIAITVRKGGYITNAAGTKQYPVPSPNNF